MLPSDPEQAANMIAVVAIVVGALVGIAGLLAGARSSAREHKTAQDALELANRTFDLEYSPRVSVQTETAFRTGASSIEEYLHLKILNTGRVRIVIEYLVVVVFHGDGQFSGYQLPLESLKHNDQETALPCPLEPHDKLEAPIDLPGFVNMLHRYLLRDDDEFSLRAVDRLGHPYDSDRQSSKASIANSGVSVKPEDRGDMVRHRLEFERFLEEQKTGSSDT
jgi:hypothetical protein